MKHRIASHWNAFEQWSPTAFLVGGGLLLASPVTKGLTVFADVSPPVWLVVLFVFPGLLAALAGLLGMYPQLVDEVPRLALAGGMVAAITSGGVILLFGWVLASNIVLSFRSFVVTAPPAWIFPLVMSLIAMSFVLFGVASVRANVHPRSTGLLLLVFAVPWIVILVVAPVYSGDLPGLLALAVYSVMPVVLLVTGYSVRGGAIRTDHGELPSDSSPFV